MEKRIEENIPVLGRVNLNFLNLSSRIYKIYEKENEVVRQKSTPHFKKDRRDPLYLHVKLKR